MWRLVVVMFGTLTVFEVFCVDPVTVPSTVQLTKAKHPKRCAGCCEDFDLLTFEEKPCTTMRTGMLRSTSDDSHQTLEVCSKKQWKPFNLNCNGCHSYRIPDLIGHWRMDEQTGNEVADDSGYENHGAASGPVATLSRFSRGRLFNAAGVITVTNSPSVNFGTSSFTVIGWAKILDVTYPGTTFAVRKGFGCYFGPGRPGAFPGWETGHGYSATGLRVCIRDTQNRTVNSNVAFDAGYQPPQLLGKWVHYAVVFDREKMKKVFVYINGKRQTASVDISPVDGSVDNVRPLEFGKLYGWTTTGTLDEYRLYTGALAGSEVAAIYKNHLV